MKKTKKTSRRIWKIPKITKKSTKLFLGPCTGSDDTCSVKGGIVYMTSV